MTMDDPELVAEFVSESSESLADIENQLLQIEETGADIDEELVNTVFRGIHSIKGVAGFLGLSTINQLSHQLEDVLNRIRNRELTPTSPIVDVMLKAADALQSMIADVENSNSVDVSEHLTALKAIDSNKGAGTRSETEMVQLTEEVLFEVNADQQNVGDATASIDQPSNVPPPEPQKPVDSPAPPVKNDATQPEPASSETTPPSATRPAPTREDTEQSDNKKETKSAATPTDANIRVSVSTLDHLMNLAGEMVLNRNRLLQFSGRERDAELSTITSDIDHITCELQDAIMQTRMQPIASVFNRFPRVVRDLSSKLGKQCELTIEGKDVECDKSIIEAIGDPLTHLVRNSVDHGIEQPAERSANGKPSVGEIRLAAYHRAGQVCIDIIDDGGGIDPQRLKDKAVSKGILSESQAADMGHREALRLIFHPGFSTAEKLTDVSGRGVGMDVVRTNIERIGGVVDVESDVGKGTTIHIVLPLTLAIIRSLIVGSGKRQFAIPQVNVAELVRVSAKDRDTRINHINDAVVFHLRGTLIPLVDIRDILRLGRDSDAGAPRSGATNIVVLETGRSRYGIIVDEMNESEEIVVKPLGRDLKECQSFAGATILGDGRVALILDVAGIAEKAQLNRGDEQSSTETSQESQQNVELQTLLIFRNSPTDQFAIPMGLVSRIERVAIDQLEEFGGKTVTQYRGGTLPIVRVKGTSGEDPEIQSKHVSVVVLDSEGGEFGVLAPVVEDIRKVPADVDTESLREDGVVGSQVIDGITTRIIDVYRLLEKHYPQMVGRDDEEDTSQAITPTETKHSSNDTANTGTTAGPQQGNGKIRILLAEDSKFFRKQVTGFLRAANYEVFEAEDGAIAWNLLNDGKITVDAVVTDIEMPNLNGLQLCQHIRNNSALSHLPVIALSSLSGDEDIQRGMQCGVTEYQVKMDRQKLLASLARITSAETVGA